MDPAVWKAKNAIARMGYFTRRAESIVISDIGSEPTEDEFQRLQDHLADGSDEENNR